MAFLWNTILYMASSPIQCTPPSLPVLRLSFPSFTTFLAVMLFWPHLPWVSYCSMFLENILIANVHNGLETVSGIKSYISGEWSQINKLFLISWSLDQATLLFKFLTQCLGFLYACGIEDLGMQLARSSLGFETRIM